MKLKTLAVFAFTFAFVSSAVFAMNLNDIVEKAKSESEYYENAIDTATKSLNSALLLNYDKEHKFGGGIKNGAWNESLTDTAKSKVSFTPYFTYSSASDNTTSVNLSVPMNLYYMNNLLSTDSNYAPSLTVSQNILLDSVKDMSSDFSKDRAKLVASSLQKKVELQYEMSLYNALTTVLTTESSALEAKASYDEALATFSSSVKAENLEEGTYAYDKKYAELLSFENKLVSANNSSEIALKNFEKIAGFSYESVEEIPMIEFSFEPLKNGNTDVEVTRLDMDASKNQYDVLLKNDDRMLGISFSTEGGIEGSTAKEWSVGGGLSYKDANFNINVSAGGTFKDSLLWKAEPTVGFELNYQSGNYESETKRLRLQNALLDYRAKAFDYETAFLNYTIDCATMLSNINAKKIEAIKVKAEFENAKKDYENVVALNEKGYYSTYSFNNETAKYKSCENAYKAFLLSCLILDNESKILNI